MFKIFRIKYSIAIIIYKLNLFWTCYFYIDASRNNTNLYITQFKSFIEIYNNAINISQFIKMFIIYDSFIFFIIQKFYSIYKKKLCILVKFYIKYNYLCKHLYNIIIIYTNYRPLIHFIKSNLYKNIYDY